MWFSSTIEAASDKSFSYYAIHSQAILVALCGDGDAA